MHPTGPFHCEWQERSGNCKESSLLRGPCRMSIHMTFGLHSCLQPPKFGANICWYPSVAAPVWLAINSLRVCFLRLCLFVITCVGLTCPYCFCQSSGTNSDMKKRPFIEMRDAGMRIRQIRPLGCLSRVHMHALPCVNCDRASACKRLHPSAQSAVSPPQCEEGKGHIAAPAEGSSAEAN